MRLRTGVSVAVVSLVFVFLFAPVVVVVLYAFADDVMVIPPFGGVTLRWFEEAFASNLFFRAIRNSVVVAIATATITPVLGTLAALVLAKHHHPALRVFYGLVLTPLVLPALFVGIALLSFFASLSIRPSLVTVVIGQSLVILPFVFLIVSARLERIDPAIEEAARDLGASALQSFWRVLFPLIRPALIGATFIALAWSFDELVITFFLIGSEPTLPIVLWGKVAESPDPSVNVIATLLVSVTVALTLLAGRLVGARELAH